MLNSKIVGAVAVVAVLSTVGVGYAVSTSSVYYQGSASAGGVSIAWVESGTGAPTTFTTGSSSNCEAYFYSTEVELYAYDLVPETSGPYAGYAFCDLWDSSPTGNSLNITNTGGFAVTLNDSVVCTPTCTLGTFAGAPAWVTASGCWGYSDLNLQLGSYVTGAGLPLTLSPGGVYPGDVAHPYGLYGWFADLALTGSGTGCAGSSFSVTVTFTGTS